MKMKRVKARVQARFSISHAIRDESWRRAAVDFIGLHEVNEMEYQEEEDEGEGQQKAEWG
jgi:hypothetical protein